MNMVEKVAKAIQTADEQNGGWPYERVIEEKHARNALFDRARAAIEAMREITPAMARAADDCEMFSIPKNATPEARYGAIMSNMVDAALWDPR